MWEPCPPHFGRFSQAPGAGQASKRHPSKSGQTAALSEFRRLCRPQDPSPKLVFPDVGEFGVQFRWPCRPQSPPFTRIKEMSTGVETDLRHRPSGWAETENKMRWLLRALSSGWKGVVAGLSPGLEVRDPARAVWGLGTPPGSITTLLALWGQSCGYASLKQSPTRAGPRPPSLGEIDVATSLTRASLRGAATDGAIEIPHSPRDREAISPHCTCT